MNGRYRRWLTLELGRSPTCPECGIEPVQHRYVGDQLRRTGYLDVWCSRCQVGIHVSRVEVPATNKSYPSMTRVKTRSSPGSSPDAADRSKPGSCVDFSSVLPRLCEESFHAL